MMMIVLSNPVWSFLLLLISLHLGLGVVSCTTKSAERLVDHRINKDSTIVEIQERQFIIPGQWKIDRYVEEYHSLFLEDGAGRLLILSNNGKSESDFFNGKVHSPELDKAFLEWCLQQRLSDQFPAQLVKQDALQNYYVIKWDRGDRLDYQLHAVDRNRIQSINLSKSNLKEQEAVAFLEQIFFSNRGHVGP